MSTDANETGKARSSRNAIRYGLYTFHDFIREGEQQEYSKTLTALMAELSPEGILEQTFATQIMAANWRLRRCGLVEFDLAESTLDPMAAGPDDLQAEKTQKSVDRARAQAFSLLRRSLAELRKLQSERTIEGSFCKPAETPAETAPPSDREVGDSTRPGRDREAERSSALTAATHGLMAGSFCKPAATTPAVSTKVPRNAPAPADPAKNTSAAADLRPPPRISPQILRTPHEIPLRSQPRTHVGINSSSGPRPASIAEDEIQH